MFRWTELADAGARRVAADYFARVDRALAALPRAEAEEVKAELEAHLFDGLADTGGDGETEARAVLAHLGEPETFLPPLVADRLRARAGRTYRPGHVAAALARGAAGGVAGLALSTAAGLGYAVAALFIWMGALKLFAPHGVGLYRLDDGRIFIGVDDTLGGADLLGLWFAPLAIGAGVVLYAALTWAFGRIRLRPRAAGPTDD
jgi:hypothetical protein